MILFRSKLRSATSFHFFVRSMEDFFNAFRRLCGIGEFSGKSYLLSLVTTSLGFADFSTHSYTFRLFSSPAHGDGDVSSSVKRDRLALPGDRLDPVVTFLPQSVSMVSLSDPNLTQMMKFNSCSEKNSRCSLYFRHLAALLRIDLM